MNQGNGKTPIQGKFRQKPKKSSEDEAVPQQSGTPRVVDFSQVREAKLEEKRRVTERIFFKHFLSVYSVSGEGAMIPIEFIDLSESGCAFQVAYDPTSVWPTESKGLPIRIYFTQDTFLEIQVDILNSRPMIENNRKYTRFGCSIDRSTQSYAAYEQFVKFLKIYAETSRRDTGKTTVFYL